MDLNDTNSAAVTELTQQDTRNVSSLYLIQIHCRSCTIRLSGNAARAVKVTELQAWRLRFSSVVQMTLPPRHSIQANTSDVARDAVLMERKVTTPK